MNTYKTQWTLEKIKNTALAFEKDRPTKDKLACMGLAFKPDIDDLRESPALLITQSLVDEGIDVLAVEPNIVEALNALGYTLLNKSNRYADAEKYLKRALTLEPDEAVIIDSYGWLQFKLGNSESALGYLQKAGNYLIKYLKKRQMMSI